MHNHQMQMSSVQPAANLPEIEIRPLHSGEDATAFRTLNEEWITRYFSLEKADRETLNDPENKILKKGGYIFMAYLNDQAVGCVALIPIGGGVYELSLILGAISMRSMRSSISATPCGVRSSSFPRTAASCGKEPITTRRASPLTGPPRTTEVRRQRTDRQQQARRGRNSEQAQSSRRQRGPRRRARDAESGKRQTKGDENQPKSQRLQHANGAHPAQLVSSQRAQVRFVMYSPHQVGRQHDPQPQPTHKFTQSIIVGKVVRQCLQAADRLQGIAPQADGLAGDVAPVTE